MTLSPSIVQRGYGAKIKTRSNRAIHHSISLGDGKSVTILEMRRMMAKREQESRQIKVRYSKKGWGIISSKIPAKNLGN